MTRNPTRALFGACALLFAAVAFNVSGALAQAVPTTGDGGSAPPITSTSCGTGTKTKCGTVDVMHCAWKFEFNLNVLGKSGGLNMGQYDCKKIGTRDEYKDIDTPLPLRCGSTTGTGSTGSGTTGTRGSGDEDGFVDETCF